ncbi:hypothetical protein ACHAXS_013482 [Conticribra weissflogii]
MANVARGILERVSEARDMLLSCGFEAWEWTSSFHFYWSKGGIGLVAPQRAGAMDFRYPDRAR